MGRFRIFRDLAAGLATVLLPLVACTAQAQERPEPDPQSIVNIAGASWQDSNGSHSAVSNAVSFDVLQKPASISTFRPTLGGDLSTPIRPPVCETASRTAASAVAAPAAAVATAIAATDSFRAGEYLIFQVDAPLANRDPGAIDSIDAVLTTLGGDRERLEVFETEVNSGVFAGKIATIAAPPAPQAGDCRLGVTNGEEIRIETYRLGIERTLVATTVAILADPLGIVFDSEDGTPVSGAIVTLVDASTGNPATVFAFDGVTPWPSRIVSGEPIVDAAGNSYPMRPGEYQFPLAPLGSYRIEITPPSPYTAPSEATLDQIAELLRPDGNAFAISDASYGGSFDLLNTIPVRVDIPLDRPNVLVSLTKTASRDRAMPGDAIFYTLTVRNQDASRAKSNVVLVDTPSQWLRIRAGSVRLDGEDAGDAARIADDGRKLTIVLDTIAPLESRRITYAVTVRPDAMAGDAVNEAEATDSRGGAVRASANVRIERENVGSRMTVIGRITHGSCDVEERRIGIPGVRVMLEDGSFAITDFDGRYHFGGLMPGTHVVQAQGQTLPEGGSFVDCNRSSASAGSAISRFVRGQGGSLVVADFHAVLPDGWQPSLRDEVPGEILDDAVAAGGETDWLSFGAGPAAFLFPEIGHNPRAPAVRVAIRHQPDEKVELRVDGEPVSPLAYDGKTTSPDKTFAVSVWRGVPLQSEKTELTATVSAKDGAVVSQLARTVEFAAAPARAVLLREQSRLVADGLSNPVIAVRITDRHGRPVRAGVSGQVQINAPYESVQAAESLQVRQLSGLGGAAPAWTITGDDGVALIELAPTMVSGPLHMSFAFTDREITREQELESWIVPGDQEWTLVGLAEGSVGARTVADNMERTGRFDSDLGDEARVAFYAKGRVLGKFLLTAAYDSAKQRDEERLEGVIDPKAYYSVFADGSLRRFDAASREKFYIRVETSAFYAIYGDFLTGFDQTDLARYQRAATGAKAEGRFGAVHVQGFAAETRTRYRRDEIQGNGLSGPYRLSSRAIVANSERVAIEVRDRFRSELIVEGRELERFVDYDIDLLSGTITFKKPVLSRDFALNPQFIVIEYEIDKLSGSGEWNAGLRGDVTIADGALRLGATAITDKGADARTHVLAADARLRLGASTEVRAEIAGSRREGDIATAWLVEAEHHTGDIDLLAYSRSFDADFGVDQQNGAELGRRKIGADARYNISENFSITASLWRDDSLTDLRRRDAAQAQLGWRGQSTDVRIGIAHFSDRYADGLQGTSTVVEGGATQRLLDNRLELSATSSIALEGTESIDLPARHRFGGSYALTSDIRALAVYEIAKGDAIDARTLRGGFEVQPWTGGRINATLGQQDIVEYGKRSFAAFGLAQSYAVTPSLTIDATLDGNRQIGGVDTDRVVNPDQPVASGGHLGQDGELFEDFLAVTLGASWRKERWSATARGEWRDGQFADRKGLTAGIIRQLGEGSVLGSGLTWTRAEGEGGQMTEIVDAALAIAHRPAESEIAFLGKLEFRSDAVVVPVAGETGPAGRTALTVDGNASSRRLLASLSTNWSPRGYDEDDEGFFQRREFGLFLGGRYNFDSFEGFDLEGFTAMAGLDARVGIGERLEIGGRATLRSNLTEGVHSFSYGPEIGFVPADDVLVSAGYNLSGFRDADYSAARHTDKGLYATVRMKFDANTFSFLGLGRN